MLVLPILSFLSLSISSNFVIHFPSLFALSPRFFRSLSPLVDSFFCFSPLSLSVSPSVPSAFSFRFSSQFRNLSFLLIGNLSVWRKKDLPAITFIDSSNLSFLERVEFISLSPFSSVEREEFLSRRASERKELGERERGGAGGRDKRNWSVGEGRMESRRPRRRLEREEVGLIDSGRGTEREREKLINKTEVFSVFSFLLRKADFVSSPYLFYSPLSLSFPFSLLISLFSSPSSLFVSCTFFLLLL